VEGLKLSYEYFCKNNIPHKKVGKLIVAQNPAQIKRIDDLFDRGTKNKVPDLQIVEKDCISKYEPKCKVSLMQAEKNNLVLNVEIAKNSRC